MNMCKLFGHKWDGCKCSRCHSVRDEDHIWNHCKCEKCGKLRDQEHDFMFFKRTSSYHSSKCSICGTVKSELPHEWNGCICKLCGEKRKDTSEHRWDGCVCLSCGEHRDEQHKIDECVCLSCKKSFHVWNQQDAEIFCTKCNSVNWKIIDDKDMSIKKEESNFQIQCVRRINNLLRIPYQSTDENHNETYDRIAKIGKEIYEIGGSELRKEIAKNLNELSASYLGGLGYWKQY